MNTWLLGDHPDISTFTVAMPCRSVSNVILKYIYRLYHEGVGEGSGAWEWDYKLC